MVQVRCRPLLGSPAWLADERVDHLLFCDQGGPEIAVIVGREGSRGGERSVDGTGSWLTTIWYSYTSNI